jgi:mono/diheme cytochrome c family protein
MKKPHKQKPSQQGSSTGGKPAEQAKASSVAVQEAGGEPAVQRNPIPVLLVALLGALVYWGNMHIVQHGGELDARVHGPYRSFKEIGDLQPKGEEQEMIARGLRVYNKPTCAACHQNDGNGSASQNTPPLVGSEWVLAKDPNRLIRIVLHGLTGPIKVKDKEWGAVAMLGWKDTLTDQEIADVLTYVRNTWGNKAPPVKADQVKKIRDETKDQSGYVTVPDLMKVPLKE